MKITTILFDADGVVQWPKPDRRAMWIELLGARHQVVDEFFQALLDLERTCYRGERDFVAALPDLLRDWRCAGTVDDLLRAWTAIKVDAEVLALVRTVRAAGVICCLATNQEPFRGRYMSQTLGYGAVFDHQFYSCELGFHKPDAKYFGAILNRVGRSPQEVLFIDDKEPNTMAAASIGIHAQTFTPKPGTSPVDEMRRVLSDYGFSAV